MVNAPPPAGPTEEEFNNLLRNLNTMPANPTATPTTSATPVERNIQDELNNQASLARYWIADFTALFNALNDSYPIVRTWRIFKGHLSKYRHWFVALIKDFDEIMKANVNVSGGPNETPQDVQRKLKNFQKRLGHEIKILEEVVKVEGADATEVKNKTESLITLFKAVEVAYTATTVTTAGVTSAQKYETYLQAIQSLINLLKDLSKVEHDSDHAIFGGIRMIQRYHRKEIRVLNNIETDLEMFSKKDDIRTKIEQLKTTFGQSTAELQEAREDAIDERQAVQNFEKLVSSFQRQMKLFIKYTSEGQNSVLNHNGAKFNSPNHDVLITRLTQNKPNGDPYKVKKQLNKVDQHVKAIVQSEYSYYNILVKLTQNNYELHQVLLILKNTITDLNNLIGEDIQT